MASLKSLRSTILYTSLLLSLQLSLINGHGGVDDSNVHDAANLHSKGLILVKIYCLLIFFFSTFIFGVSPYFLKWNEAFLLLGTQFAAGIFFATALLHFLSDATESFDSLTSVVYPFSYMLAAAGYLLTMLADVVIGIVANRSKSDQVRVEVEEGGSFGGKEMSYHGHTSPYFMRTTNVGDTILLIAALCFHSVFEGIAVGIADNKADAWKNMWTISLHKVFAAVAMGIALLRMLPKRPLVATIGYSFAFAISSPVGVGIGIGIDATTQGRTADWIFAISMSVACGIFIYVAINHLIAKGYVTQKPCYFDTPFYKFFALFLGVATMSIVMYWD
ncbi:hypothetical protein V2J09_019073 [Rumex salicifolius]